ncbi:MAG: glycosyltransferase, partial [Acidimicrobiales bacterium]
MRVLCTCLPGSGHFLPMLPLARALAAAGHEVAFATAAEFCPSVVKRGFVVFPAGISLPQQLEEAAARYREGDQPPSKERFETFVPRMLGGVAAPARAADLVPIVASWQPDVVVHDETEFAGPAVAARFGIPWADQSVGILRPLVMARRAAAEAASLWRAGTGREVPVFGGLYEYLYLDVCPPSLQTAEIGQVAVTHRVHNLSIAGPDDGPLPGWVASLGGRPTVYVSLGTVFSRDNPVFGAILAGLRDEAVNVIVTVGPDNDPAELGEQREGVYVERFIPQALLLPYCSAVINQGGTAILDILGHGLPLLVLPQGANQFHNAEACVRAGVGRTLLPGSVTPSSLRSEVRALLDVASYRDRAAVIAAELAATPGPAEGVRLLERLAEERAPIPQGRSAEMGGRPGRAGPGGGGRVGHR